MSNVKQLSTGRELVDPLGIKSESSEQLESTSSLGGTSRIDRSVDNTQYGNCPKCTKAMPIVKNAQKRDVFYCEDCRTAMPCKA